MGPRATPHLGGLHLEKQPPPEAAEAPTASNYRERNARPPIAQRIEHRASNAKVGGLNPSGRSIRQQRLGGPLKEAQIIEQYVAANKHTRAALPSRPGRTWLGHRRKDLLPRHGWVVPREDRPRTLPWPPTRAGGMRTLVH